MVGYRYDLYYVPEYPIADLKWKRNEGDQVLMEFIDDVVEHVAKFGLRNPICVHLRNGIGDVRPGKCRVTAYQRLGHETIPAIVVDYDRRPRPGTWKPLPHDAKFITSKYLSGDCVFELERRVATVKKTVDVVQRPGVENAFRRELRETNS